MTLAQAREVVAGPLAFGDPKTIEAAEMVAIAAEVEAVATVTSADFESQTLEELRADLAHWKDTE